MFLPIDFVGFAFMLESLIIPITLDTFRFGLVVKIDRNIDQSVNDSKYAVYFDR